MISKCWLHVFFVLGLSAIGAQVLAAPSCSSNVRITRQWDDGYLATVNVTGSQAAMQSWTVSLTLADGQQIMRTKNLVYQQAGNVVTLTGTPNAGMLRFSLALTKPAAGRLTVPNDVKLNGVSCDLAAAAAPEPRPLCDASFRVLNQRNSFYFGQITLTNKGNALLINELGWDLPAGQRVTGMREASYSQNGSHVSAQPRRLRGSSTRTKTLPAGGRWNINFLVRGAAQAGQPTNIAINGNACSTSVMLPQPTPNGMPTMAPEPTPLPSATATPMPQATPTAVPATPVPTAQPTNKPEPTTATITPPASPAPTSTPAPAATLAPTATQSPVVTPQPTATTAPSATAVPTLTQVPTPSATPAVTATPLPTATAVPTATLAPTATVVPTATPEPTATQAPSATPTTVAAPAPTAPDALAATVIDNAQVNITWTDSSSTEQGFILERRKQGDSAWTQIGGTLPADTQTATDATVAMGTNYEYRVIAVGDTGRGVSATLPVAIPSLLAFGEAQFQSLSCATCHGEGGTGGSVNRPLNRFVAADLGRITSLIEQRMPPRDPTLCTGNCAKGIAQYLVETLNTGGTTPPGSGDPGAACDSPPPGERSLRLLTRLEYQNTVNDLLGLNVDIVHKLPTENLSGGYNNAYAYNLITNLRADAFMEEADELAKRAVNERYASLLPCTSETADCAKRFVETFGKRAYRRPLTTDEVGSYTGLFGQGNFRDNVETTVFRMLMSPHFLYRSELGIEQSDGTYKLTPYEVAGSLSYLYLGSMPDAELFTAADGDALQTPEQLQSQASRLIGQARSRAQLGNFAGQWLLGQTSLPAKDPNIYPRYTPAAQQAMADEVAAFFNGVTFDSTHKYVELLTADYVMANSVLADYYGLSGAAGNTFQRLAVPDGSRGGLLTLGAAMARYANANESHPFKRGVYVMERLLCHEMPPPQNMGFIEAPLPNPNATTRERFAAHSNSSPSCQNCHQYIDGPGFALEHYDGAGQYRATENNQAIDIAGVLRGLETFTAAEENPFTTVRELSQMIASSEAGPACAARQYYRYAFGRRPAETDNCVLSNYINRYKASGYDLQTMLKDIVASPAFLLRNAN